MAGMLVVVAVDAQQLPVAAVLGIVVVVMIAVMDSEFLLVLTREFAAAAGADPGIQLQCALAVGQRPGVAFASRPGNDIFRVSFVYGGSHTYR
ncbi:MAG: hypothetical protein A3H91_16250 [Gammaproteobacteria bacterium RIFCSPLOWO2_02_FULL_61_13]|nr:MAG: hypothetical protein A3H91_16250 [Gammaproteobacteria bacterium RIFCSPLOWO2_02_FULL_61_13]